MISIHTIRWYPYIDSVHTDWWCVCGVSGRAFVDECRSYKEYYSLCQQVHTPTRAIYAQRPVAEAFYAFGAKFSLFRSLILRRAIFTNPPSISGIDFRRIDGRLAGEISGFPLWSLHGVADYGGDGYRRHQGLVGFQSLWTWGWHGCDVSKSRDADHVKTWRPSLMFWIQMMTHAQWDRRQTLTSSAEPFPNDASFENDSCDHQIPRLVDRWSFMFKKTGKTCISRIVIKVLF